MISGGSHNQAVNRQTDTPEHESNLNVEHTDLIEPQSTWARLCFLSVVVMIMAASAAVLNSIELDQLFWDSELSSPAQPYENPILGVSLDDLPPAVSPGSDVDTSKVPAILDTVSSLPWTK